MTKHRKETEVRFVRARKRERQSIRKKEKESAKREGERLKGERETAMDQSLNGPIQEKKESSPVGQVDGEADGAAGKGVGRDEGVGDGGLLLGLHGLLVGDGGEVLDVEGEVHGVPEEERITLKMCQFKSKTKCTLCTLIWYNKKCSISVYSSKFFSWVLFLT